MLNKIYKIFILTLTMGCVVFSTNGQSRKKKKSADNSENIEIKDHPDTRKSEYYLTEAEKYYILEDFAKSFVLYQKALEFDENNATAYYKIAQIYQRSEEYDKSLTNAMKAVEIDPDNKYFYILLAEIYTKKNNYQSAIETYQTMFERCKDANEYLFELAALYIFQENYGEAISVYDKVEEIYGVNEQVVFQKQKLYIQLNDLEGAIEEGEKLLESFPGESDYVVALAEILHSNGHSDRAVSYLENYLLEFDENNPNVKILLAEIYQGKGEKDKSIVYLKDAFANTELDILVKLKVFNSYLQQLPNKDIEATCVDLSKILMDVYPDEPDVYAVSGDLNMQLGNNQKSIEMYNTALEKGATNYNIWHNIVRISFMEEKYDDVIQYAEEAIEYYPNQVFLYFFMGTAQMSKEQYENAVESLEMGKSLSGKNYELKSTINAQLGDAYNFIKEYEKSDQSYEDALAFNPNNDHVLNNYSYFLSVRKEKLDLAYKMSSKLVKRNPDNGTFLDTHAWVLYTQGKYKDAKYYIEKAVEMGDASGTVIEHYGDILFKLGEVDSAVKQWQKAKGMDETSELIDKKIADRKLYE